MMLTFIHWATTALQVVGGLVFLLGGCFLALVSIYFLVVLVASACGCFD